MGFALRQTDSTQGIYGGKLRKSTSEALLGRSSVATLMIVQKHSMFLYGDIF